MRFGHDVAGRQHAVESMRTSDRRPGTVRSAAAVRLAVVVPFATGVDEVVALQRSAGNEAVVQLVQAAGAGPSASKGAMLPGYAQYSPPPGPYVGRRMRNDTLDPFEWRKNIFGPLIFAEFGPNRDVWSGLDDFFEIYWVRNYVNTSGPGGLLTVATPEREKAAWAIVERLSPPRAAYIRTDYKNRKQQLGALLDAVIGLYDAQYRIAKDRADAAWRSSDFRLDHEWLAVRYKRVQGPYAYWSKGTGG